MIPYYRTHGSRQLINNKPIRLGYNICVHGEAYGYVIQFEPYQSVKKRKRIASYTKWGLGENVLQLMEWNAYLRHSVIINLSIIISLLLFFLPTLELIAFKKQVCSGKVGYADDLGTNNCKTRNVVTLNSAHQAKKAVQL